MANDIEFKSKPTSGSSARPAIGLPGFNPKRWAYDDIYRLRQKRDGIPTRRELGELALQTLILDSYAQENGRALPARSVLSSLARAIAKIKNPDGSRRFPNHGVKRRWDALIEELLVHRNTIDDQI